MAQGRRVRRVVRKIDTWSVLKVAALFHLSLLLVLLIAGVLLWAAGSNVGAIDGVEKFMRAIGFEDFRFVGAQLFRGFAAAGLVLVVLGTGLSVLVAVVYNLISDVVGGIELTVLEEDVRPVAAAAPTRVAAARGPEPQPARRPEPAPEPTRHEPVARDERAPSYPPAAPHVEARDTPYVDTHVDTPRDEPAAASEETTEHPVAPGYPA